MKLKKILGITGLAVASTVALAACGAVVINQLKMIKRWQLVS